MKKLLGIIVLGLLLSGNAYAENIFDCEINTKDIIILIPKAVITTNITWEYFFFIIYNLK